MAPLIWRAHSDEICRLLAPWILGQDFNQVFAFASHRQEPDLASLPALLPTDVRLALPVITGRGLMRFYAYGAHDELTANRYGILEPQPRQECPVTERTLVLVPCVACDQEGFRLGYGGGFYDRFLAAHPRVTSLGVVFSRFLLTRLPSEAHDQPLTGVVTEKGLESCLRSRL